MKKNAVLALLLVGAFFLGAGTRSANTTPATTGPTIVLRKHLRNQTQGIAQTTLFTPTQTGMYRVSIYAAMTSPVNGTSGWAFGWNWTDDAGPEQVYLAVLYDIAAPPNAYANNNGATAPPVPFTFEAVAGQPVTFNVLAPSDNPGGTYGVDIVVERL
jgi:hypothetical protein